LGGSAMNFLVSVSVLGRRAVLQGGGGGRHGAELDW